ncbi:MAG: hypothetical protein PT944_00645 [Actinomycetaceae bacterium]|nr:hypothetical protein [Arcanobacterium sp.]MDD7686415.1 hypothetical protein [Actinomycetaceae bacterium]MDY5272695.1 hypothetical protein [Arcanobacterium sp.]
MKKILSCILVGSACMFSAGMLDVSAQTNAEAKILSEKAVRSDDEELGYESRAGIPWWSVGWYVVKRAGSWVEAQINLDGQSTVSSNSMYLVSPTIDFNSGNIRGEFYFRPNITSGMSTVYMHGHRLFALDVFSKMSLTLANPRGTTVATNTVSSNQYLVYKLRKNDPSGSWKAQYITTSRTTWQNYLRVTAGSRTSSTSRGSVPDKQVVYSDNNRLLVSGNQIRNRDSGQDCFKCRSVSVDKVISHSDLERQFRDDANSVVDQMRDYSPGETVLVSSPIVEIAYDAKSNATSFVFEIGNQSNQRAGTKVTWWFAGNLTGKYRVGDSPLFSFKVVELGKSNGVTFEGLDYFEEALALQEQGKYPQIDNYIRN